MTFVMAFCSTYTVNYALQRVHLRKITWYNNYIRDIAFIKILYFSKKPTLFDRELNEHFYHGKNHAK